MQYVATKPDLRLHSTLSTEDFADAQLVMSPDADLAGDLETAKSTTANMFLELRSRDGERSWPLSWRSKRQGSTATSMCEAEYIAMSTSARAEATPMQIFLEAALGRRVDLVCLEDNAQCLGAVKSGYSAALRSLPRTERISLSVAHETFMLTPGNETRHQPKGRRLYEEDGADQVRDRARLARAAMQVSPLVRRLAGQPWTSLTTT